MGFDEKRRERDEQHLGLLTIFNYVYAALQAVYGLMFGAMYVLFGVFAMAMPNTAGPGAPGGGGGPSGAPPTFFGGFFICMGVGAMLFILALAAGTAVCARCLSQRRGRIFCFIMSGINCTQAPMGTVLGVFTIIVLAHDGVRELFEEAARANQTSDLRDEVPPPVDAGT